MKHPLPEMKWREIVGGVRLPSAEEDFAAIERALGLFASCIKSGEGWSGACDEAMTGAKEALERRRSYDD